MHLPGSEKTTFLLAKAHLTDHPSLVDAILAQYPEESTIHDVLVFSKDTRSQRVVLTLKASLKAAFADPSTPKAIGELNIDQLYAGFVSSITSFGCFVTLPHGLIGVADKAHLSAKFLTSPSDAFHVGQSVLAQLSKVWRATSCSSRITRRRSTWTSRASTSISTPTSFRRSPIRRLS